MDLLTTVLLLVALYVLIAGYIKTYHLFPEYVVFYGPIMGIKTDNVAFFDSFKKYSALLRGYGTVGVIMVILVSVGMVVLLILSVHVIILLKPEPTAINKPQNLFLIPGINEFVPSTFAVWFAFIMTLVVHEFGHGILCRIENIRVKCMGVLLLVIPIGAFVEPDESEVKKATSWPKMRMYGAGIMNNIIIGLICFVLLIGLIGLAEPIDNPIISGVYKNYSAQTAGVPYPSIIRTIDDHPVKNSTEVSTLLETKMPGDQIRLGVEKNGMVSEYALNLSVWPKELGAKTNGFMGVSYYNGDTVIKTTQSLFSPAGFFYLLAVPFNTMQGAQYLRILGFDLEDTQYYTVPFPGYWELIHLLFWSCFINFAAGLFNALPMIPLDGGLIFKEAVERLLAKRGLERFAGQIVNYTSTLMLTLMVAMLSLPYLFHL